MGMTDMTEGEAELLLHKFKTYLGSVGREIQNRRLKERSKKMGMSIEEAHGILSNGLVNAPSEHEWCVAFKMALDTMYKYQKIEQIYQKWNEVNDFSYNQAMSQIGEVLEDGKIGRH